MAKSRELTIGIAGSGSAGPAIATLLARQGHQVSLYERAPTKTAVGAGFLLQPTGMAVLKKMGCLSELLPKTARINQLFCETTSGKILLDLPYDDWRENSYGAGVYRPTLLDLLLDQATQAGAKILWDHEITSRSDRFLEDKNGQRHGPFDLILICDGARSTLRKQSGIPSRVTRYPWGALWFIGKRTPEFDPTVLWQAVEKATYLNGYLPTGTEDDLLSLFWSIRMDELDRIKNQPLQQWKDDLLRITPKAESFLTQVESMSQLQSAAYYDVRMKRWHSDGLAILGDAAHALSPQLGQGVNLALMDATTLADCLQELPLSEALPEYSRRRKQHLGFYQFATRWTTPFFQSNSKLLSGIRDAGFPLAVKSPWFRKQMVATMAGVKTGPFSTIDLA